MPASSKKHCRGTYLYLVLLCCAAHRPEVVRNKQVMRKNCPFPTHLSHGKLIQGEATSEYVHVSGQTLESLEVYRWHKEQHEDHGFPLAGLQHEVRQKRRR